MRRARWKRKNVRRDFGRGGPKIAYHTGAGRERARSSLRCLSHGRGGAVADLAASLRGGVPMEAVGARLHLTFFYLRAFRFAARWPGPTKDHGAAAALDAEAIRFSTPMTAAPDTRRKADSTERLGASWQKSNRFRRHGLGRPPSARRHEGAEARQNAFLFGPRTAHFSFGKTKEKWGVRPITGPR